MENKELMRGIERLFCRYDQGPVIHGPMMWVLFIAGSAVIFWVLLRSMLRKKIPLKRNEAFKLGFTAFAFAFGMLILDLSYLTAGYVRTRRGGEIYACESPLWYWFKVGMVHWVFLLFAAGATALWLRIHRRPVQWKDDLV